MTATKENFVDMVNFINIRLSYAQYYLSVAYDLFYGSHNTPEKYAKAPYFWHRTTLAFRELGVLYLSQVYDGKEKDSVTIDKILNILASNYKSWKRTSPEIGNLDKEQLNKDQIKFKSKKPQDQNYDKNFDGLIETLFNQRDKSIAHYDKKELFKYKEALKVLNSNSNRLQNEEDENKPPLEMPEEMTRLEKDELQKLIDEARTICHRYMSLLNIKITPIDIKIEEDYNNLLDISTNFEGKDRIPLPTTEVEYSGSLSLQLPKSLYLSLAKKAEREGVSLEEYILALLSKAG
ncbi:hypothetical protein [Kamptonema sp. UHCC 0994]|uniref:hypothetical protein n=1 Tax=Kamptonema sp. UHCC 0994 TaxID=3031329 RepID=UPI0023BA1ABF|nr:hypothetical protein [Kamptonema sp. UHCC 0994]MDF0555130.1 hypothetical protein [Kamptonema sp. UHCC 0994]